MNRLLFCAGLKVYIMSVSTDCRWLGRIIRGFYACHFYAGSIRYSGRWWVKM